MRDVPLRNLPPRLVLLAPIALLAACSSPGPGLGFLPAGSGYGTGPGPATPPPEAPSPRVDPSALPGTEPAGTPFGGAEAGTHAFAMECPAPEDSVELLVAVEHHGERLEFTGVPG
ncbi:hypothetical protein [Nocardiopsis changdeensis]|uniref:hypothetical protein n=1 Tax=Nocardiopsis changdeensis TaxID=2831969 RepID=UPI003F45C468